ncbi:hypothetical protein PQX77_003470 [Marasmius sp. AFHP31]|nr:hypothetical protein PQX77_003470 [Marasmius sp. AFHP31]
MIAFYQVGHCGKHQLHDYLYTQISEKTSLVVDLFLTSKWSYYIPGLLAGFSILVEEKHRRTELAMYVFPKALETLWLMMGMGGRVVHGDVILMGIGMGMIMTTYQNDPDRLSGIVRKILHQLIGPN